MKSPARLLAALALVALPAVASAQTAITGSIGASATIATVFSFGAPTALAFGSITPGTAATGSGSIPLSRNVGVIYTLPDGAATGVLTSAAGVSITPTYLCGVNSTAGSTVIVTAFSSCTATTAVLTQTAPTSVITEYVVFNGSLAATATNVAPGAYTGSIRITATPN